MTDEERASGAIAEVLYFRLYQSYLFRRPDIKDNYHMLLDHYKRDPESFKIALTKNDVLRLKKMQEDIQHNRYSLFSSDMDFSVEVPEALKKEKSDVKHSEICRQLIKERDTILTSVTKSPIDWAFREFPTMYGPIDIYMQSGDTVYIVEVKRENADHAIVGQVMKYYVDVCSKILLRIFDDVKMATLCPGYDKASLIGLRQIGAVPFILNVNPLKIQELTF